MSITFLSRVRKSAVAGGVVLSLGAVLLQAVPAYALGNNRAVSRHCGTNYVSSAHLGPTTGGQGYSWAQTKKQSGSCAGRLSAALERDDGYWSRRVYGNSQEAYATATFYSKAKNGLHWGCDACNVTRS